MCKVVVKGAIYRLTTRRSYHQRPAPPPPLPVGRTAVRKRLRTNKHCRAWFDIATLKANSIRRYLFFICIGHYVLYERLYSLFLKIRFRKKVMIFWKTPNVKTAPKQRRRSPVWEFDSILWRLSSIFLCCIRLYCFIYL